MPTIGVSDAGTAAVQSAEMKAETARDRPPTPNTLHQRELESYNATLLKLLNVPVTIFCKPMFNFSSSKAQTTYFYYIGTKIFTDS